MLELIRDCKEDLGIPFKFRGKRYKAKAFGLAWWLIAIGQAIAITACCSLVIALMFVLM